MTHEERELLLATARVLRAQVRSKVHLTKEDMDDVKALDHALVPFGPVAGGKHTDEQR